MVFDKKAYAKAYYQRPEVKARVKAYNQRPDVKARRRTYTKAYMQRPEVKARFNAYLRATYEIRDSHYQFRKLIEVNPKRAKELLNEIEQKEGHEFRKMLLDGVPEKTGLIGGD